MMQRRPNDLLERALRRWKKPSGAIPGPQAGASIDLGPSSGFDVLIQERIRSLEDGLKEVRARINGLIFLVVGVVIVQVVLRIFS
ncbi:MAG: hypothetical protein IIC27_03295 [Chloroflexi bacterium]|nr:hypothetical protein [Chloroflexota bacterium]